MRSMRRREVLSGAALLAFTTPAWAQGYPDRPITIVNGFEAGGGADLLLRLYAPEVSQVLGRQLVVTYKTGAKRCDLG